MSDETYNGGILKMPFGSTISIDYYKAGLKTQAIIGPTEKPHHYFAVFEEADVDFEININNRACRDRKMGTVLELLNRRRGFVVDGGDGEQLETFDSFGGKFHILGEYSSDGKVLVCLAATSSYTTYNDATIKSSQIKFTVSYSKPFNTSFKIFVKNLIENSDDRFELDVMKSNTLGELKDKIEAKLKFRPIAVSFKSVILTSEADGKFLDILGIGENDEICITEIRTMDFIKINIEGRPITPFQIWLTDFSSPRIEQLKVMIYAEKNIPVNDQVLRTCGTNLGDDKTLGDHEIKRNSVITVYLNGCGGGEAPRCDKCNWIHYTDKKCISEDEFYWPIRERGIVCFKDEKKSEQEFLPIAFVEDESVVVISFTIEMRLKGRCSILE